MLAMSGAAHAVDISGHVAIENGGFIPSGSFVRAVLTIRNDGPDEAQAVGIGTSYIANLNFRTIELLRSDETPPCSVFYTDIGLPPPGLITIVVSIIPSESIAPGSSVSCAVLLTTYPESPAVFRQRFSFGAAGAEPDLVEAVITTKAVTQIPVSGGALLAMGLCIALVGGWRLRQT